MSIVNRWQSDKLKTALDLSWLLTVFFCFFGSSVFLIKIPGIPALYPFRVLLPVTALLYLIWAIREKRNPWKEATFIQRASYVLCALLAAYSTLSLRRAIDFSFTAPLWITLCFDLVFFALAVELCSDRTVFTDTARCVLLSLLIQIILGISEVFHGGIFSHRYNTNWNFAFLGKLHQSPIVASGNTNDYVMGLVFTLAVVLLYWAWQGRKGKYVWVPAVLFAPVYFLICAAGSRLCMMAFWLLLCGFVLYMLAQGKKNWWIPVAALLLVGFVVYGCNSDAAVKEIAMTLPEHEAQAQSQQEQSLKEEIFATDTETGEVKLNVVMSGGVRVSLLLHTLDCFLQSKGMGVGLGNTAQLAKAAAPQRGGIWAIHCFLARMTADFGIWFLIPLLMIAGAMLWLGLCFVLTEIKKRRWINVMTGVLYLLAVIIFPIASTASGDAQNSLPMWLFLGYLAAYPGYLRDTE